MASPHRRRLSPLWASLSLHAAVCGALVLLAPRVLLDVGWRGARRDSPQPDVDCVVALRLARERPSPRLDVVAEPAGAVPVPAPDPLQQPPRQPPLDPPQLAPAPAPWTRDTLAAHGGELAPPEPAAPDAARLAHRIERPQPVAAPAAVEARVAAAIAASAPAEVVEPSP